MGWNGNNNALGRWGNPKFSISSLVLFLVGESSGWPCGLRLASTYLKVLYGYGYTDRVLGKAGSCGERVVSCGYSDNTRVEVENVMVWVRVLGRWYAGEVYA